MTKSSVYNLRKSRALVAQANSHNFLYKIGDGENVVTVALADACAHGDVGCARKFTESGSMAMASSARIAHNEQVLH